MWILTRYQESPAIDVSENPILWRPDPNRIPATAMHRFMRRQGFDDYDALYRWSIDD